MLPVTKILLATDFSDGATDALDYAASLAGSLAVPLHVVHVYAPPTAVSPEAFFTMMYGDVAAKEGLAESLAGAAARARDRGAGVVETELADGTTWSEIIRIANQRGCDLIVMATHGRGGVPRFLLGSVADKVVRKATCPVLTIGPRAS
jgi:nucleotide-binding universal stress UspA family protein